MVKEVINNKKMFIIHMSTLGLFLQLYCPYWKQWHWYIPKDENSGIDIYLRMRLIIATIKVHTCMYKRYINVATQKC
jgi:hypothetical protein